VTAIGVFGGKFSIEQLTQTPPPIEGTLVGLQITMGLLSSGGRCRLNSNTNHEPNQDAHEPSHRLAYAHAASTTPSASFLGAFSPTLQRNSFPSAT
jgi:hypothetical protein